MKMLRLGIMVNSLDTKDAYREYFLPCENIDIQAFLFRPRDIDWKSRKIRGFYYIDQQWKNKQFNFPAVVYNRCYSKTSVTMDRLAKTMGKKKGFNRVTRFDKWENYQILKKSRVSKHMPATQRYTPNRLFEFLRGYQNVLLKDVQGTLGKNIYWIEQTDQGEYRIYQDTSFPKFKFQGHKGLLVKLKKITNKRKFVVQQKINLAQIGGRRFDFRVLLQKNAKGRWRVTGTLARITFKNSFITNNMKRADTIDHVLTELSYSPEQRAAIKGKIRRICIQCAKQLEKKKGQFGELGFDIALDEQGKVWIIEVNGRPSKKIFKQLGDQNVLKEIYQKPIEYATYLAKLK